MENQTSLSKFTDNLPFGLAIAAGISACLLLFFFFKPVESKSYSIISPVQTGVKPAADPIYNRIMENAGRADYPPSTFFPLSLEPASSLDLPVTAFGVMDRDTRQLLYGRNLTQRLPIASIAKVMSATVALENSTLENLYKVPPYAAKIGEASMGLSAGEKLTAEELLYGAMLPSGNDAAETLAEGVGKYKKGLSMDDVDGGGARAWFIDKMNQKAQLLGMQDTYFFNPTGLDGESVEKSSFSTVADLLALANYALENLTFSRIVNTQAKTLSYKENFHKAFPLENILGLARVYEGIKGIKPGNSVFARETLMSYAEKDGRRIIVVILGSDHTLNDVLKVYKEIFKKDK